MHIAHRLAAGLIAGSIVLGGVGSAVAAGHARNPNRAAVYGVVSNVSPVGFTVTPKAKKGQTAAPAGVAVSVSAATRERAAAGTTGLLANGEYALVVGTKTDSGIAAARVLYSASAFRAVKHVRVAGTVVSGSTTNLSLQTRAGATLSVTITGKTHFRVNGKVATAVPAFITGQRVRVIYHKDARTGAFIANAIALRFRTSATQ